MTHRERNVAAGPAFLADGVRWIARSPVRAFLTIFVVSVAAAIAVLPFIPPEWLLPHTRWETNAVAVSLATRGTFADPYALPSGPTAHVPPAMPALLALIYAVFGLTVTAGYVTWSVQVAAAATMVAMLPWLSHRLGAGREAGVIGGLAGALVPRWAHQVECLAGVTLGLLLAWHVARWRAKRPSTLGALVLGVTWGAAFHLTPSLLPVLIGCLLFEAWWHTDRSRWTRVAATLLGVVMACAPWAWRNYAVFGEVLFVRGNFGLELRMGNHEGAPADIDLTDIPGQQIERHPRTNLAEARRLQDLGEREYMREARREATAWIRANPDTFMALTARRALYFWFGSPSEGPLAALSALLTVLAAVGLHRLWPVLGSPQRAAFAIPLLAFPLVYYVVIFMPRYRVPLTGLLLVSAGSAIWGRMIDRHTPGH